MRYKIKVSYLPSISCNIIKLTRLFIGGSVPRRGCIKNRSSLPYHNLTATIKKEGRTIKTALYFTRYVLIAVSQNRVRLLPEFAVTSYHNHNGSNCFSPDG